MALSSVRFVVFDVDGTLIDSQNAIIRAVISSCQKLGLPHPDPKDRKQLLSGVGLPLREALQHILPQVPADMLDRLVATYRETHFELAESNVDLEPAFPNINRVLAHLQQKNYTLGIFTSKARRGLDRVLKQNLWQETFANIKTLEDGPPGKPDPYLLLQAMQEQGFVREQTVFIGDSTFDMEAARAAGVTAIGVAWGYHSIDQLRGAGAQHIVESPIDILKLLDPDFGHV